MKKVRIYLCLCLCLLCASCTNDPSLKEGDENPHSSLGELVPIEIVLDPTIGYVQEDLSATRMGMDGQTENVPLLSEWVSIKPSSAIGAPNDDSVMVSMELRQDTDTPATGNQVNTREALRDYALFRLIVFTKEGDNYVYQSVHDYMFDYGLPVQLPGGTSIKVPSNTQFRVIGYTFIVDNFYPMGYPLESYTYRETLISVPNFNQDFAMYDSGDQTPEGVSHGLDVKFFHQLSLLEVKINTIGFAKPDAYDINRFDATINIGGENMKWTVGSDYNIGVTGDNSLLKVQLVDIRKQLMTCMPSPVSGQTLKVHINSAYIAGVPIANLDIEAKGLVRLKPGKRHIMTVHFKKEEIGTQLAPERMTLCQNVSDEDKKALSRLRWADGNLKGTGTEKNYEWASGKSEMGVTDFGYYYTYMSSFQGENMTTSDGIDPCTLLKEDKYGSGWRTPSKEEMSLLARCADPKTVNPYAGRWFMAKDCGVYLKGAGYRDSGKGCGTASTSGANSPGRYATSDNYNNLWYALDLVNLGISPSYSYTSGFTVRCVKDGDERPAEK